jgi:hypothetical protein
MEFKEAKRHHDTVDRVGLRAHATAVGLLALSQELVRAGVLDDAAITRIKDAIASDICLSRPRTLAREEFDASIRRRLDALFSGREKVSTQEADRA